jgi:hypothetical protein
MVLVREIFELKFGKMKEARALWKEMGKVAPMPPGSRVLTDLTGRYYTLVIESPHADLAAFETSLRREMSAPGMGEWYQKFTALVESGRREIFTIEE